MGSSTRIKLGNDLDFRPGDHLTQWDSDGAHADDWWVISTEGGTVEVAGSKWRARRVRLRRWARALRAHVRASLPTFPRRVRYAASWLLWKAGIFVSLLACAARGFHLISGYGDYKEFCACCSKRLSAARLPAKTGDEYRAWAKGTTQ